MNINELLSCQSFSEKYFATHLQQNPLIDPCWHGSVFDPQALSVSAVAVRIGTNYKTVPIGYHFNLDPRTMLEDGRHGNPPACLNYNVAKDPIEKSL